MAVFSIILFGGAFFVGRASAPLTSSGEALVEIRSPDPAFHLLNPLLDCEVGENAQLKELPDFSTELESYIARMKEKGVITDAGVYFRDLNNGPWRGINANADFSPASLLKVPLMIAYLKWAEEDEHVLDRVLSYSGAPALFDQPQPDTPVELALKVGAAYRVSDLIERMIIYSDNNAKDLLQANLPDAETSQMVQGVGLSRALLDNPDNSVSVKDYASFFRVLYNASYLNREHSNMALMYLAQSKFTKGLVAGVPKDIQVAHKYGVRNIESGDAMRQLHDCGIVYYPQHPYLLCIMTRGAQFGGLAKVIEDMSRLVYEQVKGK